jgi:hypothetical protein
VIVGCPASACCPIGMCVLIGLQEPVVVLLQS